MKAELARCLCILCFCEVLPVFNDAEVKAGKVSGDEGLEDTDDSASVKLAVSICNLNTRRSVRHLLQSKLEKGLEFKPLGKNLQPALIS